MDKYTQASYLVNLLTIMDHHEALGTTKNPAILADYVATETEFGKQLEKENEARKSHKRPVGVDQDRTDLSRR